MKSAIALKKIGCGSEIINCQIQRGQISATINNTKESLKYLGYAKRKGIYIREIIDVKKKRLLAELKEIEPLVNKFYALYGQEYENLIKSF